MSRCEKCGVDKKAPIELTHDMMKAIRRYINIRKPSNNIIKDEDWREREIKQVREFLLENFNIIITVKHKVPKIHGLTGL
tara:strand:+ start:356 stop:595 length:240 start_codon:yes stop_codon:yes gene_type:complete